MKFIDAVPAMLLPKEKSLQRDLRRAEKKRQQIESEKQVARTHASRLDKVEEVNRLFNRHCTELDAYRVTPQKLAADIANGILVAQIGGQLAASLAVESHLAEIKSELRKLIVAPSEKALADFEQANAAIIKRLPKPKKAPEQPFTPPPMTNEWDAPALSPLQVMAGHVCGTMAEAD